MDDLVGLGPLQKYMDDPAVSDVLVNRWDEVYVERAGRLLPTPTRFRDQAHLEQVIQKVVALVGREISVEKPLVDARMSDGSRANAVYAPVGGPTLCIRKFNHLKLDLAPSGDGKGGLGRRGRDVDGDGGVPHGDGSLSRQRAHQRRHRGGQEHAAAVPGQRLPARGASGHHRGHRGARSSTAARTGSSWSACTARAWASTAAALAVLTWPTWCKTPCGCARTGSSSARSVTARRRTTRWRRSILGTMGRPRPSTPAAVTTHWRGWSCW